MAVRRSGGAIAVFYNPLIVIVIVDALIAAGKNLNTHEDIRNISESLFASGIAKRLDAAGFRWESYFTPAWGDFPGIALAEAGSDAKAGRNNYGLTQSIAFLNEVRGIRLADQHFQRRVSTALTMVSAILDIALENFDEVYSTVSNDSIDEMIRGMINANLVRSKTPSTSSFPAMIISSSQTIGTP